MKKGRMSALTALVFLAGLCLVACGGTTSWQVTFDADGGTATATQSVEDGGTATEPADPEKEAARYETLLRDNPPDIVVMGIGENGHIAFNDPPVADFQDARGAKVVKLDEVCRNQQVHDGCFSSLEVVPEQAVTLTIPSLFAGRYLFCMVPGEKKAAAVKRAVEGQIEEACPASILRRHPNAILYVDEASGALLGKDP